MKSVETLEKEVGLGSCSIDLSRLIQFILTVKLLARSTPTMNPSILNVINFVRAHMNASNFIQFPKMVAPFRNLELLHKTSDFKFVKTFSELHAC